MNKAAIAISLVAIALSLGSITLSLTSVCDTMYFSRFANVVPNNPESKTDLELAVLYGEGHKDLVLGELLDREVWGGEWYGVIDRHQIGRTAPEAVLLASYGSPKMEYRESTPLGTTTVYEFPDDITVHVRDGVVVWASDYERY